MATIWKGALHLGFDLTASVKLTSAARAEKVTFTQVNSETGSGVRQQLVDKTTGEVVDRSQLVKETTVNGTTVRVTQDELKAIAPENDKVLEVLRFCALTEIDPVFYAASYHVLPDGEAYLLQVFARALRETKSVALGTIVIRQQEHLVVIRDKDGGMLMHTLFSADDIRQPEQLELMEIAKAELRDAKSFIRARTEAFAPLPQNRYQETLKELLATKASATPKSGLGASAKAARQARKAK